MRFEALLGVLAAAGMLLSARAAGAEDLPPLPAPASAPAPSPTLDTVYLRDGGLFRGRVTELVPKDHVTIASEEGDTKRIPWPDVDRVIVAPVSAAPPPPAATPERGVFVHVSTPKPVFVYRRAPGSTAWERVCASPCDKELPTSGTYRVTGNDVAAKELSLQATPGEYVDLKVEPPSSLGMLAGGLLMAGSLVAIAISAEMDDDRRTPETTTSRTTTRTDEDGTSVGDAIGLVGGGMLIGGILCFVFSRRTVVSTEASKPAMRTTPLDASERRPTWRRVSSAERALTAPAAMFPLVFEGRF